MKRPQQIINDTPIQRRRVRYKRDIMLWILQQTGRTGFQETREVRETPEAGELLTSHNYDPRGNMLRSVCTERDLSYTHSAMRRWLTWHAMYSTCNMILGSVPAKLLQWKSNKYYTFWMSVCSLRYPACNSHAPLCHLWSVRLYNIFPHYIIIKKFPKKMLLNIKCVFSFPQMLF